MTLPLDPESLRVGVLVLVFTIAGFDLGIAYLIRAEKSATADRPGDL